MKILYFHIDKSGQISENFQDFNGANYLITGEESYNAFTWGIINGKGNLISKSINERTYEKIIYFFKLKDESLAQDIISEIRRSDCNLSDIFLSRLIREIIFEDVRINFFPLKPSRLKCIFLSDRISDMAIWKNYLNVNSNYTAYYFEKVDPSKFSIGNFVVVEKEHRTDAKLLEVEINDIVKVKEFANEYWAGRLTASPLLEILFYGILKEINVTSI